MDGWMNGCTVMNGEFPRVVVIVVVAELKKKNKERVVGLGQAKKGGGKVLGGKSQGLSYIALIRVVTNGAIPRTSRSGNTSNHPILLLHRSGESRSESAIVFQASA